MRILSVGRPLANPAIDNHSIFNAPAFSDFEAIAIDPAGVLDAVREAAEGRGDHRTYSDLHVVNGPSQGDSVSIADILHRRRDETARLLERGGIVVVFGAPQSTLPQVLGFTGADRYHFLPAPAGLAWVPPLLVWGEGQAVAITAHAHPFARYIEAVHDDLRYRAVFDDRSPAFIEAIASSTATVFARTGGGAPVGVEFAALGGRVVFLPAGSDRASVFEMGTAIEAAVRDLLALPDPGEEPPFWLDTQDVPGLAPLTEVATVARDLATTAAERAAAAESEAAAITRVRDVLWREGPHGLLPAVLRCCELLGFAVYKQRDGVLLRCLDGDLLLEAEGAIAEVGMAPHYRLRARIDAAIAAGDPPPRGLVVANGQRHTAPDRRDCPYLDALRVASEATRYALLPAPALFAAARAAMTGADPATLATIRQRLIATDGLITLAGLLGES